MIVQNVIDDRLTFAAMLTEGVTLLHFVHLHIGVHASKFEMVTKAIQGLRRMSVISGIL